jgi:hypothetical protein
VIAHANATKKQDRPLQNRTAIAPGNPELLSPLLAKQSAIALAKENGDLGGEGSRDLP